MAFEHVERKISSIEIIDTNFALEDLFNLFENPSPELSNDGRIMSFEVSLGDKSIEAMQTYASKMNDLHEVLDQKELEEIKTFIKNAFVIYNSDHIEFWDGEA